MSGLSGSELSGSELSGRERDRLDDLITRLPKGLRVAAKALRAPLRKSLFGGDEALFHEMLTGARLYGEYGMGLSTQWVDQRTDLRIISVDTAPEWVRITRENMTRPGHEIRHIDVGEVGKWGRPLDPTRVAAFRAYMEGPVAGPDVPDVVLVDGRFRVACCLTAAMRCAPGALILFDDYRDRPHYHVVEEVLPPLRRAGRQTLFRVPETRDLDRMAEMRAAYEAVLD